MLCNTVAILPVSHQGQRTPLGHPVPQNWPPCQLLHIYQIAKAPVISRGLFAPEIDERLKVGGHVVGISRLSISVIFRNLLDLASKNGAGDRN